jgi:hypothetical protein
MDVSLPWIDAAFVNAASIHGRLAGQETIFEYKIDREGRNRYCNTYFVSPLLKNCRE